MPSLPAVVSSNALFSPSYIPVGVFIGGTSGIGQAMAEALARYTSGRAHIIIIGRNSTAGKQILDSLPRSNIEGDPELRRDFIHCDAALMKNVQATANDLLKDLPKINYLILSAGFVNLGGRDETEEGIDKQLALRYYSRWKFIHELLPLLRNAKDAGEDAKVMSVLGAGHAASITLDDLAMKKSYSGFRAAAASVAYNDYMLEEYSLREPDIAFTHIFPGVIDTPAMRVDHWAFKLFSPLIELLMWLFSTSPKDCAEYMWFALLDGNKGFFRRDNKGENIGMKNYDGTEGVRKVIWEHSAEVTNVS